MHVAGGTNKPYVLSIAFVDSMLSLHIMHLLLALMLSIDPFSLILLDSVSLGAQRRASEYISLRTILFNRLCEREKGKKHA